MNKWILIAFCLISPLLGLSQAKLMVLGKCPDCYVQYKPKVGETVEQIAGLAALTPEKLLSLNGVKPGENSRLPAFWRIPITLTNLQKTPGGMPVYHVIERGDNLYRINLMYFQPGISLLQEWNSLRSNSLKDGELLLVGYLGTASPPVAATTTPIPIPVVPPSAPSPVYITDSSSILRNERIEAAASEGYFAAAFNNAVKGKSWQERSGLCATFKSITGWNDQRFYVLMNDVPVGSTVRISAGGDKFICASVIGPIPDMKINKGLMARLSNAAARQLDMGESMFAVTIQIVQ
ncbi:MAG: LysM peptidoglycan-binding domain-containing protein [Chitinophagaceae bacterium]|nr:LysM peptidoglycan-binding domain-containing protein [Chitinophagaceae bacterium]